MMIGERVLKQYGDVDYDLLLAGIQAQHKDQETLLSLEEAGTAIKRKWKTISPNRLKKTRHVAPSICKSHAEKEGVQVTESGLQYMVITEGDGAQPTGHRRSYRALSRHPDRRHRIRQLLCTQGDRPLSRSTR